MNDIFKKIVSKLAYSYFVFRGKFHHLQENKSDIPRNYQYEVVLTVFDVLGSHRQKYVNINNIMQTIITDMRAKTKSVTMKKMLHRKQNNQPNDANISLIYIGNL